jgi:hypothetical protein
LVKPPPFSGLNLTAATEIFYRECTSDRSSVYIFRIAVNKTCTLFSFDEHQLYFLFSRGGHGGGRVTSDGGVMVLAQAERTSFPGLQPWDAPDPLPVMRRELKLLLIEINVLRVEVERLRAMEQEARNTEEFLSASVNQIMIAQVPPWSLFWWRCVDSLIRHNVAWLRFSSDA